MQCKKYLTDTRHETMKTEWFKAYTRRKGKHPFETFAKNVDVFIDLTVDAHTGGDTKETRETSFAKWTKYIQCPVEAGLYFAAVDEVTTYS